MKFKPGDKLIALESIDFHDCSDNFLIKGNIYTFIDYYCDRFILIEENDRTWKPSRFELAYIVKFNKKLNEIIDA